MSIIKSFFKYFREQQAPAVRRLHYGIIILIAMQLLLSNFMGFTDNGEIKKTIVEFYGTWAHIITGLVTLPIALAFVWIVVKRSGLDHYNPYVDGDFPQIKRDIAQIKRRELPEPNSRGIAAVVQGLGMGGLLLVLLSGFTWYVAWINGAGWASYAKETHKLLTGVIIAYAVGHGVMGLLHIHKRHQSRKMANTVKLQ